MVRKVRKIDALTGKLIITVSIVIVICICSLLVSQSWIIRQMRNDVIEQNMNMLELTQTIVDAYIDQTLKLSQLLLLNKNITRFIYQGEIDEGSSEIQTIIDAQEQLPATRSVNPMLEEVYIYSKASGYLLNTRNAIFDIDKMYPLIEFQGMNSRQWQSKYLWSSGTNTYHPSVVATVDGQKRRVLPYIQTFPLSNPTENAGKLMLLLDEDFFERLLSRLEIGESGRYCVTDANGTIIMSNGDIPWNHTSLGDGQHDVVGNDGIRHLISVASSDSSRLRFFSALPYNELQNRQNPIWGIFSFSSTLALIVCFIIIVFAAYESQKDWNKLKQLFSNGKSFSDDASYEQISNTIKSITERQTENELLIGRTPFMTETIFRRLIHGKDMVPKELEVMMERTGHVFPIDADMMIAMAKIIWHNAGDETNIDDIDFSRIAATKEAERIFNKKFYLYMDLAFNVWLLVWNKDRNRLNRDLDVFWTSFRKITPYEISMAVSNDNHTLGSMKNAPEECNFVVQSIVNENRKNLIRRYSELQEQPDSASYDKDAERLLLSSCLKRDAESTRTILERLYDVNFKQRKLAPDQTSYLFKALYATAITYCQKENTTVLPKQFSLFSDVSEFFLDQSGAAVNSKDEREKQMISHITTYISEHFKDPGLTLSNMAVDFKMRENYLYHFMSTRMGTSFSQYLENHRLAQAKDRLLVDPDEPINEVALSCGYANPQTFRRAFKKRFGVLPSDYRIQKLTEERDDG